MNLTPHALPLAGTVLILAAALMFAWPALTRASERRRVWRSLRWHIAQMEES